MTKNLYYGNIFQKVVVLLYLWEAEAAHLREEGLSYSQIAVQLKSYFPNYMTIRQISDKIRRKINQPKNFNESVEYNSDGVKTSIKLLEIADCENITPNEMLKLHGLSPIDWEVSSYTNNYWNSQVRGGKIITLYQSKLVAKVKKQINFSDINRLFDKLNSTYKPVIIRKKPFDENKPKKMVEVNIADLHLGKLCWCGDTNNNFDYKICRDIFFKLIEDIYEQLYKEENIEYILFVWSNDFFNSDTISKTTTAGTQQDTDIRWQKLFDVGVEMLVNAIELLSEIAPVKTFYIASNHDKMGSYYAIKFLQAWYRNCDNIFVDTDPISRKYVLFGNTLLGFTHGDKEKPKNLAQLMPIEQPDLWAKAKYREFHTAHLHSEHSVEELNGVIVRRVSSPTAIDTYHFENGYVGAVRKVQTFIYEETKGLRKIINSTV